MTTKLEILKAELDALEAADAYDAPQYDWLAEQFEALQLREAAKPAAPQSTPTTAPAGDPLEALSSEMQAMLANPERFSDAQRDQLVSRYNHAVTETGRTGERVDVAALAGEMTQATADPSKLTDEQRAELSRRYNQAILQGPERRPSEALRGELGSTDLPTRMRAAAVLQERGELDDATASEVVSSYNAEVAAAATAIGDPNEYPEELRPIVEAQQTALEAQQRPADPVDHATRVFNDYVSNLRPPTVEQQLEALGVQAEPVQEQVPEPASQEA